MKATSLNPWLHLWRESWMLGAEACWVIGLRSMKLAAGGPAAAAELNRMVSEKLQAGAEL